MQSNVANFLQTLVPLAESITEGVLIADAHGHVLYANVVFEVMCGHDRHALCGHSLLALYDAPSQEVLSEALRAAVDDRPVRLEFHVPRADGDDLPVMMSCGSLDELGGPQGLVIVTFTDISELKRAQGIINRQARALEEYAERLESEVRERTYELHQANIDSIYMLALAGEARDPDTGRHVRRIQHLSEAIALEAGLEPRRSVEIGYSAILHDVGKIVISDKILNKPGPLTEPERRIVQRHTIEGERILGDREFFRCARTIARRHHEAWDGSGYPDGLRQDNIPVEARIVAIADMYDALVTERVYKKAWEAERSARQIETLIGVKFDPEFGRAFLRIYERGEVGALYDRIRSITPRELPAILEA